MKQHLLGILLALGFIGLPLRAAQPIPFSLSIDGQSLVAANARKGDTIVFFGDAIENRGSYPGSLHVVRTEASSLAGESRVDFSRRMAKQAIWIAVDIDTGDVAKALPAGSQAIAITLDIHGWPRRPDGTVARMLMPFQFADILLVRPHEGAWFVTLSDGSRSDADGVQNGVAIATIEGLAELKKGVKAPAFLRGNDVIVAIDPLSLRYAILKVTP